MTHTPTPWIVNQDGNIATANDDLVVYLGFDGYPGTAWAGEMSEEDAAFIVKAVNNHEHLVGALIEAFNELSALEAEGYAFSGMDRIAAVLAAVE